MTTPFRASPIIQWPGGKRRLLKRILPLLPAHKTYVEPFAGGAAVFFGKEPVKVEILNDWNTDLINLYRMVRSHTPELLRLLQQMPYSRDEFERLKLENPATLTECQRAARFFALQRMSFGAKVVSRVCGFDKGTDRARYLDPVWISEALHAAAKRLKQVQLEHRDFAEIMRRFDGSDTLMFCDPPYWELTGYGVEFPLARYQELATFARQAKGAVFITVNDCPTMREVFADLIIDCQLIKYTMAANHGKPYNETGELFIANFNPPRPL
ncbi:DNA adenine methylase [Chitiniphilus eburneus]|uniref:DNA adenine methylase n=1 Tax=Chitiniphilus eburneus TaxID=2571148 RepID=UPI0035CFCF44